MKSLESVKETINNFIKSKFNYTSNEDFECTFIKMDSLSNDIYQVIIIDKKTKEKIIEIAYRNFGEISELVNRPLEEGIIISLSKFGIGPKIYETDHKNYRIEEFVTNSFLIPFENLRKTNYLNKIFKVLVSYCEICPIYKFELNNGIIKLKKFNDTIDFPVETNQNIFELCMKNMYNKGMKALLKFKENLEKVDFPNKENTQKELNYMLNFSNNLLDIFYSVFPLKGYLTLNHNDTLRLNFLQKDDKILIIDHEYGSLNLPGFDIVNYLVESNFDSSPEYIFVKDDIDFNKYYNIYLGFLNEFEKSKKHSYFFKSDEGKKQLNIYKSYEYFSNLIVLDIILWFVFGLIYFDFNKFVKNEGFNYFKYSYDRIVYYDLLMKFNESRNESKSISRNSTSSEEEVIVSSN